MTFFRLGFLAAALGLSSCTVPTAPEPPEFKLSAESLSKQYRATRKTGSVRLYAHKIETTRDEWGRESHVASGGAILVKETVPPIHAMAPSIRITPEFSEVSGKATVRKNDLLYISEDESTKIRIDGTAIIPEGPHVIRTVAEAVPPAGFEPAETVSTSLALTPTFASVGASHTSEPPPGEPVQEKSKKLSKSKVKGTPPATPTPEVVKVSPPPAPKPSAPVVKASPPPAPKPSAPVAKVSPPPAKPSAPVVKASPAPAKPAPAVVKASTPPPPAPKPKEAAPVDRSRLLNLMREPTER